MHPRLLVLAALAAFILACSGSARGGDSAVGRTWAEATRPPTLAEMLARAPAAAATTDTSPTTAQTGAAQPAPAPAPAPPALDGPLPPLPAGWPRTLQLGLFDGLGGTAAPRGAAPFGFRYQYLAGGVNTGNGWATWAPDGSFVSSYIDESVRQNLVPVFTYYMMVQSRPGAGGDEGSAAFTNLQARDTMIAYFNDLKLLLRRAAAFPSTRVVLHVEPDLWGFLEQTATAGDAAMVPAQVAATGLPELVGLPDSVAGFARAIVRLRDAYAPNVLLAYHVSVWGTGRDIFLKRSSEGTVDAVADWAADFYRSLGAPFDLVFGEFSDRDAGFKEQVYGDRGASWWDEEDFAHHVRFLARFVRQTGKRVVLWQIPIGNTRMRAMNNTWNHFQDNRVEWLLDDPTGAHLAGYRDAGVIGLLFGRGADGATCGCDANKDGVTNPEPINGNTGLSLNADDDGGFLRQKAAQYYAAGPLALP